MNRPCSCTLFHLMSNTYSHGSLQLLVLFSGIWVFLECVLGSGLIPVLASFLNPPLPTDQDRQVRHLKVKVLVALILLLIYMPHCPKIR